MATFGIPSSAATFTPSIVFSSFFPTDTSTTDDSDAEDSYNQAQDTFSSTARAISIGWIVGIVVIVLAVKIAVIAGVLLYRRNRKRKRERSAQLIAEPKPGGPQPPPVSTSALGYGGPSELVGQEPSPRYEVPNTEMSPRELPNNEIARPPLPGDETPLNQRVELPV
ncbi:hypothetical protein F4821DRAFT_108175 [Hypoxylon rubiginosum]|uniref:Uncharacterized protein n=1 Tax=Hypoxylon rubiginosum TaxID=110542 RepID=A0ACC0D4Z7_9PEZI|nr:hypothetical protein F4821DRAFT_108175 [Hypoxylon rubiginosum]